MPTPSKVGDRQLFIEYRELLTFLTVSTQVNSLGIETQTRTTRFQVRAKVDVRVQAVALQIQQTAASTQGYYAYFRLPTGQTVETNDLLEWRRRLYKVGGLVFEPGGEFVQISIEQEQRNAS